MYEDNLKRLFYRSESTFYLEKYVTNMIQIFNELGDYNVPLYEEYKVRQLLDKINCPNNNLKTGVNIFRSSHSDSFKTASTYLSTVISCLFPETEPSS